MRREPLIEEYFLGESNLESYYFAYPHSAMAIHCDIPEETKRSRELEAHGYHLRPPTFGERACFAVESVDGLDDISIAAVRRGLSGNITEEEIRAVVRAFVESDIPDVWWIGWESRQHVHTVAAILDTLHGRGRLPRHESWG